MKLKHLLVMAAMAVIGGGNSWAQTDVTSMYLVNPSFELKAEGTASTAAALSKTGGTYYGWNLPVLANDYSNVSIGSSSACDGNGFGIPSSASEGNFYFFNRRGWNATSAELSQTANLPAGKYFITVDYKAYEREVRGGTIGFSINGNSIFTTKPYFAATANSGTWAVNDPWKTVGAWFTVENEGDIKIAITEKLDGTKARADLYLDNVRLYKWDLDDNVNYANASKTSPLDVTAKFVQNPYFDDNVNNWTSTTGASSNKRATNKDGAHSGGFWENWNASAKTSGKMSQTVTGLPSGIYKVTASAHASQGTSANVSLFANDNKQAITWQDAPAFYSVESSKVTDGNLEIGLEIGAGNACFWLGLDNVRLEYIQPTISVMATEIPVSDVTTSKWYKYTVATAGEYKITSSAAASIKYTQDGNLFDEDVTTSLTFTAGETKIENLTAGTIYVNSDVASTIEIAPNTYSYEVGSATADIAYVQAGKIVTVSYTGAATNNDEASFAINGTPSITFGGNAIAVTPTANGFTFTVPEVTAATDYTLNIPADAFGYAAGSTYNEAQNIVLKTPAILDQIAYIYSPKTEKFVSRGDASGTSAIIDAYGIPVQIVTDGNNNTTFKFVDNGLYLFNDNWAYTDGAARNYTVQAANTANYSGYTFVSNSMPFYINGIRCANNGIKGDNYTDDDFTIWQIKTKAERDAIKKAKEVADIVAVAAAAGETVTSLSELEAILATKVAADQTSKVKSASFKSGIDGWTATSVRKNGSNAYTTDQNVVEFYESAEKISQTVSDLEEGIYKVTLNGFARFGSNANCVAYADYDLSNAYLKANNYQINLKSWASERTNDTEPNSKSSASTAFSNGSYLNTLYTYVGDDGKLTLTIDNPNYMNLGWVIFNNLTLTYYGGTAAVEADYTALASAITAAEANTLGFEEGEYAPYTNIDAIKALNAAKAIDTEKVNLQSDVQAATKALNDATWTANTEEMDIVYDGTFANAENNGAPAGWTMSDNELGGATHSRAFVGDTRLSEFNDTNSGLFIRFDGTYSSRGSMYYYGKAEGYTMPLKANTTYYVSADFAGWGSTGKALRLNVTGPEGFTSVYASANTTNNADTENVSPQNHTIIFTTGSAGDYVISFQNPGASVNQMAVVSNIVLKKLTSIERSTAEGKYGTICAPFEATATGATVYSAEVKGESVTLTEVGTELVAGVPYIYQATADAQTFTCTGASVSAPITVGPLTGVFTATQVPVGKYVMQTQGDVQQFYIVAEGKQPTLSEYKAYLSVPSEAKSLKIGLAEETAIKAIDALMSGDAKIYDINGREQKSLQKGVNIVNGVKVMVK